MLLLCLLAPQWASADGPPRKSPYPDGVTAINPGSELWSEIRRRDQSLRELTEVTGVTQVKGVDSGTLINARGDQWARFRMEMLTKYGGIALAAVFAILVVFFVIRGQIKIESGTSGQMVQRYTSYERIVHWTLAIVFLLLAITGLVLLLGRPLLIPLFGKETFSVLASLSKEGHNLIGPLFLVSLFMMLFSFVRKNLYEKGDLTWLLRAGGAIGKGHLSVGFFNTGEKMWFWILMLVGLVVSVSGLILLFPNFGQGRVIMELSHVIHSIGALLLVCVSLGHMYMGSVGMEGAFEGMRSGYVDINWAEEHHDRWGSQCRDNNLVVSADEFTRVTGRKPEMAGELAIDQGK